MTIGFDAFSDAILFRDAGGIVGHGHAPELFRKALVLYPQAAQARDRAGYTFLMSAARLGCESSIEILLPLSDAKHACFLGETALMCAAANGHARIVEKLCPTSDIHAKTRNGHTAFGWACHGGHLDVVKVLISHGGPSLGALPCAPGSTTGLMIALLCGNLWRGHENFIALAQLLLPFSDLLAVDDDGFNAIGYSARSGNLLSMELAARAIHERFPAQARQICQDAVRQVEEAAVAGHDGRLHELSRASERLHEQFVISESAAQPLPRSSPAQRI